MLALIPTSLVLRKVKAGYQLGDLQGKVNHLLFMDDQNKTHNDTLVITIRTFSKDITIVFVIISVQL